MVTAPATSTATNSPTAPLGRPLLRIIPRIPVRHTIDRLHRGLTAADFSDDAVTVAEPATFVPYRQPRSQSASSSKESSPDQSSSTRRDEAVEPEDDVELGDG